MKDEFFKIREEVPLWRAVLLATLPPVIIVLLWYWATSGPSAEERRISPSILPNPVEVVQSFPLLWGKRELVRSILYSLGRVAGGFCVGMVVAVPLGIAMGAFTKVKNLFLPMAVIGGYTPIAALVPLTLMWWGIGENQKVMFLAIATFIYLLPLVFKAVDQVDDVYLETAYTLGATKWQVALRVMVPIAMSEIYVAMRLGFAIGWSYIILAEIVNAENGLGYLIIVSQRQGPREHIFLVILIIAIVGFLIDKVWERLGMFLFPYRAKA